MAKREHSLRTTLTVITVAATVLACAVAATLVVLTSSLRTASFNWIQAVESVRLLEEAELDLLMRERTRDPVLTRELEAHMRERLEQAHRFIASEAERRAVERAESTLDEYLRLVRTPGALPAEVAAGLEATFEAIESVVTLNVVEAQAASRRVESWDRLANTVGVSIGAALLLLSGGFLWWLNSRAFRPMLALGGSIERFAQGDRGARAEVRGPLEIREMARRFNEMAAALAVQREAQMSFLGGVAHDLRNPLSVLKVAAATVRPEKPLPPEPRIRKMLDMISRQVVRLERMVTDLLDMAGIEAGRLELKLQRADLRGLVGVVVELFEGSGLRHRLVASVPDQEVPVRCDPLRIEQVLGNLLSNAIKYSPEADQVEVSLAVQDGQALLSVTDHGIGIPEDEQPRLFEPFRRIGLSTDGIPGVGLGLFVVQQIVEAHRGRIEVRSVPGMGSTFRVFLPLAADADALRAEAPERTGPGL
jgi:signal transduction histidine kinase